VAEQKQSKNNQKCSASLARWNQDRRSELQRAGLPWINSDHFTQLLQSLLESPQKQA
jgi:hypothetical protein